MVPYLEEHKAAWRRMLRANAIEEILLRVDVRPNRLTGEVSEADVLSALDMQPQEGKGVKQILMEYPLEDLLIMLSQLGQEIALATRPRGGAESQWRIVN